MKKITFYSALFLCFLVMTQKANSQTTPIEYATIVSKSNYIFEGKVIQSTAYKNVAGNYTYTSNTIQITKIFKGNLQCGTVEIITNDGIVNDDQQQTFHSLHLNRGVMGVFACNVTSRELSAVDFYPENNLQKLQPSYEQQSFIQYVLSDSTINAYSLFYNIDSLTELYNLTQIITGIYYTNCDGEGTILYQGATKKHKTINHPAYKYVKETALPQIANTQPTIKLNHIKPKSHITHLNKSMGKTLSYTLVPTGIDTTGGHNWYTFDVDLADDVGGFYFVQANVVLTYDTVTFGTNVSDSMHIQVTRGTLITDTVTYSNIGAGTLNANTFDIPTGFYIYSGFSPLTTSPQSLMHVKMEMQNCSGLGYVKFTDTTSMLAQSYYDTTSSGANPAYYDNITLSPSIFAPSCGTHIQSLSPQNINGGRYDVLSIIGTHFGNARGNGKVLFRDANWGGGNEVAADNWDYIDWSDTLIHLYVMSADSGFSFSNVWNPYETPGTGVVKVITNDTITAVSLDTLRIEYAVNDGVFSGPLKLRADLTKKIGLPNDKGYLFYVDSAIWNKPDTLAVIKKALHDWTCATGVNWEIIGVLQPWSGHAIQNDTNLIQFNSTTLDSSTVAQATSHIARCVTKCYNSEIDLEINLHARYPFFTDTTGLTKPADTSDLYQTVLHELGHAHQLCHVNDKKALMYFSVHNHDALSGTQRKIRLYMDASGVDGGQDVMTHSTASAYLSGCPDSTITVKIVTYCTELPVEEIRPVQTELLIYPNPTSDFLNVSLISSKPSDVTISVFDIVGQTLKEKKGKAEKGKSEMQIDVSNLSKGIYICSVYSNYKKTTLKFIKQ